MTQTVETSQNNKNGGCRDNLTLLLSILSFIVATCSMFISKCAVDKSEEIAERSGAFDKGELHLSFEGYIIDTKKTYEIYFGIPFHDSVLYYSSIPTGVQNSGKKTVENVELVINYPHNLNLTGTR